jgi:hypothetical protein
MRLPAISALLLLAACAQDEVAPVDSTVEEVTPGDTAAGDGRSLADPTVTGPIRQAAELPEPFRGVWDIDGSNCDPMSDLRLEIGEGSIGFYESVGSFTAIDRIDADTVRVTLAMEGEGERWEMERILELRDGGQRLVPSAPPGEPGYRPVALERCEP